LGGAGRGREISGGRGSEDDDGGGCEKSEEGRRGEIYSGVRAFRVCVAEIRAGVMDLISWPFPGWWDRGWDPLEFFLSLPSAKTGKQRRFSGGIRLVGNY
jgi:hypothetical protein